MSIQVNFKLSDEALSLLHKFAPSPRSKGAFLERLIFEHERSLYDRLRFREIIDVVDKLVGVMNREDEVVETL